MSEQTVDPRDNPESAVAEEQASQTGARTSEGGVVMSDAPTSEEGAHGVIDGRVTGSDSGDMLAGLRMDPADAKDAVAGDDKREPGGR